MGLEDALLVAGKTLSGFGTPTRKYSSPLATGISSALVSGSNAVAYKKAKAETDRFKVGRDAIEAKIGVPYDFFLKLSHEAQTEILRNAGFGGGEPPLDAFGGRTMSQLKTEGAPSPEATVPGGTGAFAGLPPTQVQTGPALPPLNALSATGRDKAVTAYLGQSTPPEMKPYDEARIGYLDRKDKREERRLESTLQNDELNRKYKVESIKSLRALAKNRTSKDAPVSRWLIDTARLMGVGIPEGVNTVTRQDFNAVLKFKPAVMAVVSNIETLAYKFREAELEDGRPLTDQELEGLVTQATPGLPAMAGDEAVGYVISGVKKEMQNLRTQTGLLKDEGVPGQDEKADDTTEEDSDGDGIPDDLEGDEQDFEEQQDDEEDTEAR